MKYSAAVALAAVATGVVAQPAHHGLHARFHEKKAVEEPAAPETTTLVFADFEKREHTLAARCCDWITVNDWKPFQNTWGACAGQCGGGAAPTQAAAPAPAAPPAAAPTPDAAPSPAAAPAQASPAAASSPAAAASSPAAKNQAPASNENKPSSNNGGSSSSSSSGGGNSASGGKKGLSYNVASLITGDWTTGGISWAYNWASTSQGLTNALQFVPMLHDLGSVGSFASDVANVASSTPLLSFNEPDMPPSKGGSQIDPSTAAAKHKEVMGPLSQKGHPIGCPAVSNSEQGGQGLDWLSSFASACGGSCAVDFCPVHWYGWNADAQSQATAFQQYMTKAISACQSHWPGKPIWVTEFAANDASGINNPEINAQFLNIVGPWMEKQAGIQRYSPFMVGNGDALGGSSPSAAGQALINISV